MLCTCGRIQQLFSLSSGGRSCELRLRWILAGGTSLRARASFIPVVLFTIPVHRNLRPVQSKVDRQGDVQQKT